MEHNFVYKILHCSTIFRNSEAYVWRILHLDRLVAKFSEHHPKIKISVSFVSVDLSYFKWLIFKLQLRSQTLLTRCREADTYSVAARWSVNLTIFAFKLYFLKFFHWFGFLDIFLDRWNKDDKSWWFWLFSKFKTNQLNRGVNDVCKTGKILKIGKTLILVLLLLK